MAPKGNKMTVQNMRLKQTKMSIGSSSTAYPSPTNASEETAKKSDDNLDLTSDISETSVLFQNSKITSSPARKRKMSTGVGITTSRSKVYTKAIQKTEESDKTYSSSYSQPSRGRLVHEDLFSPDLKYTDSSSLSSTSSTTCGRTSKRLIAGKQPKVTGIKNLNYRNSTTTIKTMATSVVANTNFVTLSHGNSNSNKLKLANPDLSTSLTRAKNAMSATTFLSSLMPLSDLEIAAYNKRKIQERKKAIYEQWKEDNKKLGRRKSELSHAVSSTSN